MSTNHTPNYGLCQWEASDQVLRAEFNEDNAKIDAALGELKTEALRLHTGAYQGTGTKTHIIELPFKPQFFYLQKGVNEETRLMVFGENTVMVREWYDKPTCMFNSQGCTIYVEDNRIRIVALDGLSATEQGINGMNEKNVRYYYMALG